MGYNPWGCNKSDMTEQLTLSLSMPNLIFFFSENPQNRRFACNHAIICFIFYCYSEYIDSGLRIARGKGISHRIQAPKTCPNSTTESSGVTAGLESVLWENTFPNSRKWEKKIREDSLKEVAFELGL